VPNPYQAGSITRHCDQLNTHGIARRSSIRVELVLNSEARDGFVSQKSPLGQLELDAAVAPVGILGPAKINWLKFAKSGGDKVLWRYTLANEILHHRDCARGR
jgi:hypothetical protein